MPRGCPLADTPVAAGRTARTEYRRPADGAVPGPRIGEITGPAAAGRAAAQATGPPRTSTAPGLFSHDMSA